MRAKSRSAFSWLTRLSNDSSPTASDSYKKNSSVVVLCSAPRTNDSEVISIFLFFNYSRTFKELRIMARIRALLPPGLPPQAPQSKPAA